VAQEMAVYHKPLKCSLQLFIQKSIIPQVSILLSDQPIRSMPVQRVLADLFDSPKLEFHAHISHLKNEGGAIMCHLWQQLGCFEAPAMSSVYLLHLQQT
jgi:hypothetical protein